MVQYSHHSKHFPVCCDPHSQRLLHSQWSRNRYFSGIPLLSLWSNKCCQFDLLFLWLFTNQLICLEVLNSSIVEAWLEGFLSVTLLAQWAQLSNSLNILYHCLWNWDGNWSFPVLWLLVCFPNWPQNDLVTHLEPDIQECEVRRALGSTDNHRRFYILQTCKKIFFK